jgi:hypothetical protein
MNNKIHYNNQKTLMEQTIKIHYKENKMIKYKRSIGN